MNTLVVVAILLLIVVAIYMLFGYTATANKNVSLLSVPSVIETKDIVNQTAVNYTYSFWLNVSSWSNTDKKPIITFAESTSATNPNFTIYLDPTDSNLYCDILTLSENKKILITSTLPLQTWVHVAVSVENDNVDCYLNGKMTNAVILQTPQQQVSAISSPTITIGSNKGFNAAVQRVVRAPYSVDPYTVWLDYWTNYTFVSSTGVNWNLKVALLKDKTVSYETTVV
jgi:Tfp pilus assembly protein PilE